MKGGSKAEQNKKREKKQRNGKRKESEQIQTFLRICACFPFLGKLSASFPNHKAKVSRQQSRWWRARAAGQAWGPHGNPARISIQQCGPARHRFLRCFPDIRGAKKKERKHLVMVAGRRNTLIQQKTKKKTTTKNE